MTLEQAQAIINTKYPQSRVQEVLPNGDVLLVQNNGKTLSRVRAADFASMTQKAAHLAQRPKQPTLDAFTRNQILIEKYGYERAMQHKDYTPIGNEPQQLDTSDMLPSEMSPAQRGLPSNRKRPDLKLPSER